MNTLTPSILKSSIFVLIALTSGIAIANETSQKVM